MFAFKDPSSGPAVNLDLHDLVIRCAWGEGWEEGGSWRGWPKIFYQKNGIMFKHIGDNGDTGEP